MAEVNASCPQCKKPMEVVVGRKSTARTVECEHCHAKYDYSCWVIKRGEGRVFTKSVGRDAGAVMTEQPDLFDVEEVGGASCPQAGESPAALSSWREVPQAVFDSWSEARQLAYCAARDEDAARCCEGDPDFYAARAARYREMMNGNGS